MRAPHPDRMPRRPSWRASPCDPPARFPAAKGACPHASPSPSPRPRSCSPAAGATRRRPRTVAIKSFKYAPATVHVKTGARVTLVNRDAAGHTATFTAGPSKLDTDRLGRGDRAALSFPKAGRYAYVCAFHAFMKGDVVVDD